MSKSKLFLPPSNESYFSLRGPSTLTGELRTGDCKTTLEAKKKIGNLTYYVVRKPIRDAESELNN